MNVTVEKLEKNMAKLTVTVEADRLDKAIEQAYQKQKGQISVPGFRKGKVPRQMIEKMYGPNVFAEEAANILIKETYPEAFDQCEEDIVSQPAIEIVTVEKGKDFVYTAEVALRPEVKLGKYKGLSVTKADTAVTDAEVEDAVKAELEKSSRIVDKDGAVADGDTANIDFEGFQDGVAFEGGKGENYPLVIGSGSFIPGFEEQLIGAKAGDEVDVNVTFPEEYQAENLAGKPALFKVKVNSVSTREVPTLDDEYVADTTEFENVADFKADLKKKLEEKKAADAKRSQEDEAIEALIEASEMEIPDAMIESQVNQMINDFAMNMSQQGLTFDQYLQFTGGSIDDFKEQVKPEALRRIQSTLVLEEVAKAEGIEATDDEVEAKFDEMAAQYGLEKDKIKEFMGDAEKDSMKNEIKIDKAITVILENAKEKAAKKATKKKKDEEADAE